MSSSHNDPPSLRSRQLLAVDRMLSMDHGSAGSTGSGTNNTTNNNEKSGNYDTILRPSSTIWKVLIYDVSCRSIVSPLLPVSALRKRGVTLHLLLNSKREAIPDVPAVYFIEPTRANLKIVANDVAAGLYQSIHLNLSGRLGRELMEEFASGVVRTRSLGNVASVVDRHLDFVCPEEDLFYLSHSCGGSGGGVGEMMGGYAALHGGGSDAAVEAAVEGVAWGLLSVIGSKGGGTGGGLPIIRCPSGGAPEMIARRLCALIADHPGSASAAARTGRDRDRPLLVLLDRNADLAAPLRHASPYQALIDDLLDHRGNRVEFVPVDTSNLNSEKKKKGAAATKKRVDLDPDGDPFYSTYRFRPFPEAVEGNGTELKEVTEKENAIRSGGNASAQTSSTLNGGAGGSANTDSNNTGGSTDLARAVDSLPALLERKRNLELHTSVLQAVMNGIAKRNVPRFHELENRLIDGGFNGDPVGARNAVTELACGGNDNDDNGDGPSYPTIADRARLVCVYCLTPDASTVEDVGEVALEMANAVRCASEAKALAQNVSSNSKSSGKGVVVNHAMEPLERAQLDRSLAAIEFLRRHRSLVSRQKNNASGSGGGSAHPTTPMGGGSRGGMVHSISGSGHGGVGESSWLSRASHTAAGVLAGATEKLGNMLGGQKRWPLADAVSNLVQMRVGSEDESYLFLDPVRVISGGSGGGGKSADVDPAVLKGLPRLAPRDVTVFVVGGGCYAEYQNVRATVRGDGAGGEGVKGGNAKGMRGNGSIGGGRVRVTYGSTDMLNPEDFLNQLGELS